MGGGKSIIFEYLMKRKSQDQDFFFRPRIVDRDNRLAKGYWFLGDDNYLSVSFWSAGEASNKTPNICIEITNKRETRVILSAKDSEGTIPFLQETANKCTGYRKINKSAWQKNYQGIDYLAHLESFLNEDKPIIDSLIESMDPPGVGFLDDAFHEQYVGRIIDQRAKRRQSFNSKAPVVRKISK